MNLNINPLNQTKLFGFQNEFNELKKSFDNNNLPSKILLYGKKGIGKNTFAFHLINYALSKNEDENYDFLEKKISSNNKSFKLMSKQAHPNCHIIDLKENKLNIDISQIREMFNFINKSSFNNKVRFVLINSAENLNLNSANALLKALEDKSENICFIFVHDSNKQTIETVKSRCLLYNLFLSNDNSKKVVDYLLPNFNFSSDFFNYYNTPGDIYDFYNFCNYNKIDFQNTNIENLLKIISNPTYFKNNKYIDNNISKFIEIYFYKKIKSTKNTAKYFSLYRNFVNKIKLFKKYNLDLESILIEFESAMENG